MWIIRLLRDDGDEYIAAYKGGFSNTECCPLTTLQPSAAKQFAYYIDAKQWARSYLPAYKWVIIPFTEG